MTDTVCEHLDRAPITEALIDIRATLRQGSAVQDLNQFRDAISADFPNCRERRKFHGQITFGAHRTPEFKGESDGPDGYLMTSADGTQIVQGRLDGFTFSRLKPYEDWEKLRDAASSLWNIYCSEVKPVLVTRIAVRYINRLELPMPVKSLKDWILTVPEIAPGLPQDLAGFFVRLHVPFPEYRSYVNITMSVEKTESDEHVPLIFDIDAFQPLSASPDGDEIWDRFRELHKVKNKVFFETLTERALEQYR